MDCSVIVLLGLLCFALQCGWMGMLVYCVLGFDAGRLVVGLTSVVCGVDGCCLATV